jgi:hypothetical protein
MYLIFTFQVVLSFIKDLFCTYNMRDCLVNELFWFFTSAISAVMRKSKVDHRSHLPSRCGYRWRFTHTNFSTASRPLYFGVRYLLWITGRHKIWGVDCIQVAQNRAQWQILVNMELNLPVRWNPGISFTNYANIGFLKKTTLHGVAEIIKPEN